MAEAKPFSPVKLICGVISFRDDYFKKAEEYLIQAFGRIDLRSPVFEFNFTDYYEKQMGSGLKRKFFSFKNLVSPEKLSMVKLQTNSMEQEIRREFNAKHRVVNLDPGYLTASSLVMATAKDFAHRIPLQKGIYAHLELLFTRKEFKSLAWTYPDFRTREYKEFFKEVRRIYLEQMKRTGV